jgi:hypothetical protein
VQVRQVSEDHAMAMALTARDESLVTHDKSADMLKSANPRMIKNDRDFTANPSYCNGLDRALSAKLALRCPDTIVMLSRSKTHM